MPGCIFADAFKAEQKQQLISPSSGYLMDYVIFEWLTYLN